MKNAIGDWVKTKKNKKNVMEKPFSFRKTGNQADATKYHTIKVNPEFRGRHGHPIKTKKNTKKKKKTNF